MTNDEVLLEQVIRDLSPRCLSHVIERDGLLQCDRASGHEGLCITRYRGHGYSWRRDDKSSNSVEEWIHTTQNYLSRLVRRW